MLEFLLTRYLPSRIEVSRGYAAKIQSVVRRFSEHLGHPATLMDLTEENVCSFLAAYRQKFSARTTNDQRQILLMIWYAAFDAGLVERPPRKIRKLPEEHEPPNSWTLDECNRLFATAGTWPGHVGKTPAGPFWASLCLTVYWTACRIGSLLATPREAYDGAGLTVCRMKNRRPQFFPLPPSCCAAIEAILDDEHRLIWEWPHCRRYFFTVFRRIVEAAGLPSPRESLNLFHRLRRTSLTLCASVDPAIAQRQAGHASYRTTFAHYIDPRACRGLTAADVLPEPMISRQFRIVG